MAVYFLFQFMVLKNLLCVTHFTQYPFFSCSRRIRGLIIRLITRIYPMKQFLIIIILFYSGLLFAKDNKNQWQETLLTEKVIKKIQLSQWHYKKCINKEMIKSTHSKQKSRQATGAIIKQCEAQLAKMRGVYINSKIPEIIADRHLKKMRTQMTRHLLKVLMFKEATKQSGR